MCNNCHQVPYLGCEARIVPFYLASGIDLSLTLRYFKSILTEGCGKNGSTVAVRTSYMIRL